MKAQRTFSGINTASIETIVEEAVGLQASDVHLEPSESDLRIRFRIDGNLHDMAIIPKVQEKAKSLVNQAKVMSGMDVSISRLPQDGRYEFRHMEKSVNLRFSSMPQLYGEKIVIRLFDLGKILDIENLGFIDSNLKKYKHALERKYGMILVTGPTGTGKTTTLYAALNYLNRPNRNIITVEDPIEIHLPNVNQIQVQPKIGLNFENVLRSILRQDPDIIMVGEIRDKETAEIAIHAALTGHMVLSTLHTNHSVGTIARLLDMGIPSFLVSSSLTAIVAQRLVNKVCNACKTEQTSIIPKVRSFSGKGCTICYDTGFRGRTIVEEVLIASPRIKRQILINGSSSEIFRLAKEEQMTTLKESAILKAHGGIISLEEAIGVTDEPLPPQLLE
jgi:type IV pilus assembly protein PilB